MNSAQLKGMRMMAETLKTTICSQSYDEATGTIELDEPIQRYSLGSDEAKELVAELMKMSDDGKTNILEVPEFLAATAENPFVIMGICFWLE